MMADYEELRRQALRTDGGASRGFGLALLVRQGMKSWMEAGLRCRASLSAKPSLQTGLEAVSPMPWNREVVMILASMALHSNRQEVRP
jgi:hypothetical protein